MPKNEEKQKRVQFNLEEEDKVIDSESGNESDIRETMEKLIERKVQERLASLFHTTVNTYLTSQFHIRNFEDYERLSRHGTTKLGKTW